MKFLLVPILSLFLINPTSSYAIDNDKARSSKRAWAAFECSIFASYARKEDASKALFKKGYNEIIKFLTALEAKEITEQEFRSVVPVGISFSLGGPSIDFVAGRIYENVSNHASDEIIKEDSSGMLITDPAKWNNDEALKTLIATNKYSDGNCDLLKK